MFRGRISLNLVLLVLIVELVSGFSLELMYISLIVSIMSGLTLPRGKVKFQQASNHCKTCKQKSPSLPRNLTLSSFGKLLIVFSTKVKLLYLLYAMASICCPLHLIKQNCFLRNFLRTLTVAYPEGFRRRYISVWVPKLCAQIKGKLTQNNSRYLIISSSQKRLHVSRHLI